ncbi:MAG: carboxypeptidase regulatory-like domain-containing protein [Armatimonadota bacterium]
MQKTRWIAVLVLIGVLALSLAAIAQIPTANWPRFQRDAYNSGRSPATTIAKPVLKWQRTLTIDSACSTTAWSDVAKCGIIVDPDGNVVVSCSRPWSLAKFNSSGVLQWNTSIPTLCKPGDNNYDAMLGGPAVTGTNSNYSYLAGPGFDASGNGTNLFMHDINPASGASAWSINCALKPNSWNRYAACTPTVAANGEIYVTTAFSSYGDLSGMVQAINPTTMARDWGYGDSQDSGGNFQPTLESGVGPETGTCLVIPMDVSGTTKNVIFRGGGWIYDWTTITSPNYIPHKSFMALADNGTGVQPTLLWQKTFGFHRSQPVMSNDGTKMYIAGFDQWYNNGSATDHACKELTSFSPLTGVANWQIDLPTSCMFSPAVGADGTLYVTGSAIDPIPTNNQGSRVRYNPSGRLVAVTDNGTSATIKWTLDMPGELGADMSNAVVISNSSHKIVYVAAGKGHVYCVEDLGDHPKILWAYNANISNYIQPNGYNISCGTNRPIGSYNVPIPGSLALADDGTLYAGWADQLLAFDTGYDTNQSYGIHGTVTDANGNPVAGAMVSVSTSDHPLIDNADGIYTTTNSDGTYQVSVGGVSGSTTYYVSSWKEGYAGTDASTVTLSSETSSATANFTLNNAKFNWALLATAASNNVYSTYTASKATDGVFSTWFQTPPETTANFIKNMPTYLQVDLGQDRSLSEATVYWTYANAKSYSIDYLADGQDPATGTWNTLYSTTTGTGGYPTSWTSNALSNAGSITSVLAGTGTATMKVLVKMPYTAAADTIKFPSTSARYWRVYATASSSNAYTQPQAYRDDLKTTQYIGIGEIALRDTTLGTQPYAIPGAKNTPDGGGTIIPSAVVTATPGGGVPTDTIFIETADRTSGIKVHMTSMPTTIQFGDKVSVAGKVYTTTGTDEKYVEATAITRLATTTCPDGPALAELSMNNKAAADSVSQGLFIKTWGKVSNVGTSSFNISDGSASPIKVLCGGEFTMPANDDYIRVRGCVSKDTDGTVLYMRNERADWVYDSDNMHALPFTGTYKYPIQYLVLGPFTAGTDKVTNLDTDFIGESSIGATVFPVEGMTTAGKTWFKATSANEKLDLNAVLGGTNINCAAYAHIYVWSDTEAPSVVLVSGSDDALKYYVNGGTEVFRTETTHLIGGNSCPITLHKGLNSILFKVVNGTGAYTLGSQIVDSEYAGGTGYGGYAPYPGLGYSLNPVTP